MSSVYGSSASRTWSTSERLDGEHTFWLHGAACSWPSTPSTASWSCSRSGGVRWRAVEAAAHLFAIRSAPEGLARSLVADLVAGDSRLSWSGSAIALASAPVDPLLEEAELVVFDLETTGLSARSSRICEIGAVRVRALELVDTFETFVRTGAPIPAQIRAITGIRDEDLRGAPGVTAATRSFLAFAGDATLVAHNARFDVSFLDRQLERLTGRRLAGPALDTAALARRLLAGRVRRVGLASLAHFFGTSTDPCHRALPDAQATAEVLVRLIGLAQERGARTLSDLHVLAAPRARRVHGKRSLAHGAPRRPGVYLFRDRHEQVLYVGRARDLRTRLRSYFRSDRQRPAVEAALGAVARIEWRVLGSELEAGLEELRLIRDLRPPGTHAARGPTGTCTCGDEATASWSARRPARSGRSEGAGGPSGRPVRSTARRNGSSRCCSPGGRCPGSDAGWPISRRAFATRTRPACATASPRWRP